jgi:hypothetical protein
MKSAGKLAALALVAAAFALTFAPSAASAGILDGSIVPQCFSNEQGGEVYGSFSGACQLCDLITLASNLIQFAVAFAVVAGTVMFAYAGMLYFTAAAKPDNIKKAHGIFVRVVAGLVIILIAWLIIDLIMKTLTGGKWGPWNEIPCIEYPTAENFHLATEPPTFSHTASGTGSGTGVDYNAAGGDAAEIAKRAELANIACVAASGYADNNGTRCDPPACGQTGTSNCTNVVGLDARVVSGLQALRAACNCTPVITGGTEAGHSAGSRHNSGRAVDLRITEPVITALLQSSTRSAMGFSELCTNDARLASVSNCSERERHVHLGW